MKVDLLKAFGNEELCLTLSSYLETDACWCLQSLARNFLSREGAKNVRQALHLRQEFSDFFAILDSVLSWQSPQQLTLQELHDKFRCSPVSSLFGEQLGQVLTQAHDLFEIHELPSGELALSQQTSHSNLQTFSVMHSRLLRFEATLASHTEALARQSKLCISEEIERYLSTASVPKRGRKRLSRQSSITLPKNAIVQDLGERMKAFQSARSSMMDCQRWISTIKAAETARLVLETLFAKGDTATVDRVHRILTAHQSNFRCGPQVTADKVPMALLLLLKRSLGGLTVEAGRRPTLRNHMCFHPFRGLSSCKAKRALESDLNVLKQKHRRLAADADQAFLATMHGTSVSLSGDEGNTTE